MSPRFPRGPGASHRAGGPARQRWWHLRAV